jgi:hypothetical protein
MARGSQATAGSDDQRAAAFPGATLSLNTPSSQTTALPAEQSPPLRSARVSKRASSSALVVGNIEMTAQSAGATLLFTSRVCQPCLSVGVISSASSWLSDWTRRATTARSTKRSCLGPAGRKHRRAGSSEQQILPLAGGEAGESTRDRDTIGLVLSRRRSGGGRSRGCGCGSCPSWRMLATVRSPTGQAFRR